MEEIEARMQTVQDKYKDRKTFDRELQKEWRLLDYLRRNEMTLRMNRTTSPARMNLQPESILKDHLLSILAPKISLPVITEFCYQLPSCDRGLLIPTIFPIYIL